MNPRSITERLLQAHYNLSMDLVPEKRVKSEWTPENNFGFFLGIVAYGEEIHRDQLHSLLSTEQFPNCEQSFLDSMFAIYIRPYHSWYTNSSCSRAPVRPRDDYRECEERDEKYELFESAVARRDRGVCLICWSKCCLVPTLILNIPREGYSHTGPEQAGVERSSMHYVQNALYLCLRCHGPFGRLLCYVDVSVNNELLFTVVDNDERDLRREIVVVLRGVAVTHRIVLNRRAVADNGDIALYFADEALELLPNREFLEQHKTACLIWKMAEGTENDMDEYCCIDDDDRPRA